MRDTLEFPRLSLAERDRRWNMARREMKEKGLDCLVLFGWPAIWDFCVANARYLCPVGGNAEFNVLVFPLEGDPTCFVQMPTFIEGWRRSQEWVSDIRTRKVSFADSVSNRLAELGLQRASIGVDGLTNPLDADGWTPYGVYTRMKELLPNARLSSLGDMMEKMRAVKSAEEIEALTKAAALGNLMLEACRDTARPGVKECEVYARVMQVMLANGGEEPTLFLWGCDANPFPHPFRLPTTRRMERGDVIICEMHPKLAGYGYYTHVERTFCLGEPEKRRAEIYDGCMAAYHCGMELFGPGKKIIECLEMVREVIDGRGLEICEAGIHGHGLASLEYPKYRLHNVAGDREAVKAMNNEFRAGMVFAYNIDLFDASWRKDPTGAVFAETVVITETGARRMHEFSTEIQVLPA
jgi:Xaa-Pro dipeptidase